MKKILIVLSFLSISIGAVAQKKTFEDKAKEYIKKYGGWAMEEQQRVGIPASITLAQGIYETGAGESELATQANNHFGIKCKKEWRGATFAHTDDSPNECFRKYTTAKESYQDHSDYLKNSVRYAELFTYDKSDYASWAKGLKRCGYATNPAYAQKLIKMVEDYDLQIYTFAAAGERQNEIIPTEENNNNRIAQLQKKSFAEKAQEALSGSDASSYDGSVRINDIKAIYCIKGETLLDKAMKYNIRYARLLEINELADEPIKRDMHIYLEPKKSKGAHPTYLVKEGETIELIAHNEGMNSRQLRIYNLLAQNEQPVPSSILKLQSQSDERPATYKMIKTEPVAAPEQNVRLIIPNQSTKQDEFLLTKKSAQKVEEMEFGYGAERPAELEVKTPQPPTRPLLKSGMNEEVSIQKPVLEKPIIQISKQEPQLEQITLQLAKPIVPSNNAQPKLENEINTKNEESGLPLSLEPEQPQDELSILKAKLDKAVYARTSKSNMKVSSDDSSAVFNKEIPTTNTAKAAMAINEMTNENAQFHIVQKGETGYSIAKKYGIKIKQLNEWNKLNFEGIKIGQKLRVK